MSVSKWRYTEERNGDRGMLTLKECEEKIKKYQHKIKIHYNQEPEYHDEYILHIEHLIEAYEREKLKALVKPMSRRVDPERGAYNKWAVNLRSAR